MSQVATRSPMASRKGLATTCAVAAAATAGAVLLYRWRRRKMEEAAKLDIPWTQIKHVVLHFDNVCAPATESVGKLIRSAVARPNLQDEVSTWSGKIMDALQRCASEEVVEFGVSSTAVFDMMEWKRSLGRVASAKIAVVYIREIVSKKDRIDRLGSARPEDIGLVMGALAKAAYRDGTTVLEPYSDLKAALERWTKAGAKVHVYSGAAMDLQRSMLRHTTFGDLNPLVATCFDPKTVGNKAKGLSFGHITLSLLCRADEILHVSNRIEDLQSPHFSFVRCVLMRRAGESDDISDLPPNTAVIDSFKRILPPK